MPPLLQSAQLKPDVTITSADSDAEFDEDDDRCFFSSGYRILYLKKKQLTSMLSHDVMCFRIKFILYFTAFPCLYSCLSFYIYLNFKHGLVHLSKHELHIASLINFIL